MLKAISPIDGRYASKTDALKDYFSEFALIKYRVFVEVQYFLFLNEKGIVQPSCTTEELEKIKDIHSSFSEEDALRIKEIEKLINHDVKAVEYLIKEKMDQLGIKQQKEFVHFGLTSQDINNTSIPLMIKDCRGSIIDPLLKELLEAISQKSIDWIPQAMLAHTHGQPASPTNFGKEMRVFYERLSKEIDALKELKAEGKFGGATGNLNAHQVAFPSHDWINLANTFSQDYLGLERQQFTTQISHYDDLSRIFMSYQRICTMLIDFSRDIWTYISMEYISQSVNPDEVGSSAMPHKVNPIDFENAEGNLGLARAIFSHLSDKLPISRLQRDLTDSTVTRNIGVPFGHLIISIQALLKGLKKIDLNKQQIDKILSNKWIVLSEAIQSVLRKNGYEKPYEKLKELTRGKDQIGEEEIHTFIQTLDVDEETKSYLMTLKPELYTGIFPKY